MNSDRSVADTIALMGGHVRNAASSIQIKQALEQAGCLQGGLTEDEVIEKVFNYVKGRIQFVEDDVQLANVFEQPQSKEFLITPPTLLTMPVPMGDCDDFSMLVCSMLIAKGVGCDFVTIAANRDNPTEFSHVYCMARTRDGRSIPVDASHGKNVGWEKLGVSRKQIWPVFNWGIGKGGMGMVMGKVTGPPIGPAGIHVHALSGLSSGLQALVCCDDEGNLYDDGSTTFTPAGSDNPSILTQVGSTTPTSGVVATAPSSGFNWNSILPGLFSSVEKVAQQTSQPAGIQQQVCNAQGVCSSSSTVYPTGYTGSVSIPALPGLTSAQTASLLPIAAIVFLVLVLKPK